MGSRLARRCFALFGLAAALVALLLPSATTAGAIVGGQPTGAQYSNVGLLWIHSGPDIWSCSGTLISPTVVVTAAHCTGAEYAVDRVDVTFAAVATDAAGELTSPSIPGAAHFDPRYLAPVKNGGTKAFVAQAAFDRGVVVLSSPAAELFPGITPALLPILGVLDAYATAANAKNTQGLVSVGDG